MRKLIQASALLAATAAPATAPRAAAARTVEPPHSRGQVIAPAGTPVPDADRGVAGDETSATNAVDWRAPHRPGVYLLADRPAGPQMIRIEAVTATQTRTGGAFGFALSGGVAPMKMKSVLPNATAPTRSMSQRPTFFFYVAEPDMGSSAAAPAAPAATPAAYSLVRFEAKKASREAGVGSYSMYAGLKTGVTDKDRIAIDAEQMAAGVFKVTPRAALVPGEYGFVQSVTASDGRSSGKGIGMTVQVFDFSVTPSGR